MTSSAVDTFAPGAYFFCFFSSAALGWAGVGTTIGFDSGADSLITAGLDLTTAAAAGVSTLRAVGTTTLALTSGLTGASFTLGVVPVSSADLRTARVMCAVELAGRRLGPPPGAGASLLAGASLVAGECLTAGAWGVAWEEEEVFLCVFLGVEEVVVTTVVVVVVVFLVEEGFLVSECLCSECLVLEGVVVVVVVVDGLVLVVGVEVDGFVLEEDVGVLVLELLLTLTLGVEAAGQVLVLRSWGIGVALLPLQVHTRDRGVLLCYCCRRHFAVLRMELNSRTRIYSCDKDPRTWNEVFGEMEA